MRRVPPSRAQAPCRPVQPRACTTPFRPIRSLDPVKHSPRHRRCRSSRKSVEPGLRRSILERRTASCSRRGLGVPSSDLAHSPVRRHRWCKLPVPGVGVSPPAAQEHEEVGGGRYKAQAEGGRPKHERTKERKNGRTNAKTFTLKDHIHHPYGPNTGFSGRLSNSPAMRSSVSS